MFDLYVDTDKLPDSMCYDSGTPICAYTNEQNSIVIEVRGHVKVYFNDDVYTHYSDMPEELQQLFITGRAYSDDRVGIQENNWYEVFLNGDEDYDVADVDGYSTKDLEQYCKNCLKLFKGEA